MVQIAMVTMKPELITHIWMTLVRIGCGGSSRFEIEIGGRLMRESKPKTISIVIYRSDLFSPVSNTENI